MDLEELNNPKTWENIKDLVFLIKFNVKLYKGVKQQ